MVSNFDFFKKTDKELYEIILESEKLFRSEYFSQCVIQTRIFAEKMAKKISNNQNPTSTFDDILNNLKDRIQTEREKEFIEDLFFIKKQGNACAHGEETTAIICLDVLHHAFEAAINYTYFKKKDEEIDKLIFDDTLLITQKKSCDIPLIDKYLKRAQEELTQEQSREQILNKKQGEFLSQVEKKDDEHSALKDKNALKNPKQYKEKKINPKKEKIKEKIKQAKKNLKDINKTTKNKKEVDVFPKYEKKSKPKQQNKPKKSQKNKKTKQNSKKIEAILFILFTIVSILLLFRLIF